MKVNVNRVKLVEKRYASGYGIKELAAKANVSQMTIFDMESGKRIPTPASLKRICEALGINPTDVIEVVA